MEPHEIVEKLLANNNKRAREVDVEIEDTIEDATITPNILSTQAYPDEPVMNEAAPVVKSTKPKILQNKQNKK